MKTNTTALALLGLVLIFNSGCVAFPPLINVEQKGDANNEKILRKLDSIEHRLDNLEKKPEAK